MKKLLLVLLLCMIGLPASAQVAGFYPSGPTTACPVPTAISATSTSANQVINSTNVCGQSLIMYNDGASDIFYRLGSSNALTALVTDNPLPPNSFVILGLVFGQTYIAVISTASSTVRFSQGTVH
jgi:hypothetical protein